jgi:beta-lactamase regulating signal transducer with metallopeptidase domain
MLNALVPFLNRAGDAAIQFAGDMLWQASLVIAVIFVLDLLLRNRARAALRYGLWLLVLVKLLLPPSLALPTGIGYWIQVTKPEQPTLAPITAPVVMTAPGPEVLTVPSLAPVPAPKPTLRRAGLFVAFWASGVAVLFCVLLVRSWRLTKLVAGAEAVPRQVQDLTSACAEELKLARNIPVRLSDSIGSPAVCGLWAPVILLPRDLSGRLSGNRLRPVLLHELLHVKRRDVWINCLQAMLQAAYWWHPFVWFANAHIRRTREEAVDEGVMVALGEDAPAYPETLLEVAKGALRRPMTALGLVGIFESRSALKQRIRRLVGRPVPQSARLDLLGLAVVLAVGALALPMAEGTPANSPEADEALPAPKTSAPPTEIAGGSEDVGRVPVLGAPSSDQLVTRTYRLKLGSARNNLPKQFGSVDLSLGEALRRFLGESGVALDPSADFEALESPALLTPSDDLIASESQNFRATVSEVMLTFRATPEHHARIWSALETLNRVPPQITIEAKFIEVPRRLEHMIDIGTPLPLKNATGKARMLDETQTRSLLGTLKVTSGVDVMAAPRVTTLSGRQTQVKAVDVRSIVSAVNTSGEGPKFVSEPMELGPSLDLIPTADLADGTVELLAILQLREFLGYATDEPSSGPTSPAREDNLTAEIDDAASASTHALWRDRRATARARIYNRYTLMLTEPQVSITTRRLLTGDTSTIALPTEEQGYLVVLISATMIDPAGNPLRSPEPRTGVPPQPD